MNKVVFCTLVACVTSTAAQAVDIYPFNDYPEAILIDGEIGREDGSFLRDVLNQRANEGKVTNYIMLNSPGGVIGGATDMATVIRDRGIKTYISGDGVCASACVIAFAAGTERYIWRGGRLGVHAGSEADSNLNGEHDEAPDATVYMARWLEFYGAPAEVIAKLVTTPNSDMSWLTESDLNGWVAFLNPNEPQREEQRQTNNDNAYSMSCRSTATGNYYDVYWQHGYGAVAVGARSYIVNEYHVNHGKVGGVATGNSAWVVSGTTHINTKFTAVFGGRRPLVEFYNGSDKATDLCN